MHNQIAGDWSLLSRNSSDMEYELHCMMQIALLVQADKVLIRKVPDRYATSCAAYFGPPNSADIAGGVSLAFFSGRQVGYKRHLLYPVANEQAHRDSLLTNFDKIIEAMQQREPIDCAPMLLIYSPLQRFSAAILNSVASDGSIQWNRHRIALAVRLVIRSGDGELELQLHRGLIPLGDISKTFIATDADGASETKFSVRRLLCSWLPAMGRRWLQR